MNSLSCLKTSKNLSIKPEILIKRKSSEICHAGETKDPMPQWSIFDTNNTDDGKILLNRCVKDYSKNL